MLPRELPPLRYSLKEQPLGRWGGGGAVSWLQDLVAGDPTAPPPRDQITTMPVHSLDCPVDRPAVVAALAALAGLNQLAEHQLTGHTL